MISEIKPIFPEEGTVCWALHLSCATWMFPSILDLSGVPLPSRRTFTYPGSYRNANSDHEEHPLFFFYSHGETCKHNGCARPRRRHKDRSKIITTFQFGVISALQLSANHLEQQKCSHSPVLQFASHQNPTTLTPKWHRLKLCYQHSQLEFWQIFSLK